MPLARSTHADDDGNTKTGAPFTSHEDIALLRSIPRAIGEVHRLQHAGVQDGIAEVTFRLRRCEGVGLERRASSGSGGGPEAGDVRDDAAIVMVRCWGEQPTRYRCGVEAERRLCVAFSNPAGRSFAGSTTRTISFVCGIQQPEWVFCGKLQKNIKHVSPRARCWRFGKHNNQRCAHTQHKPQGRARECRGGKDCLPPIAYVHSTHCILSRSRTAAKGRSEAAESCAQVFQQQQEYESCGNSVNKTRLGLGWLARRMHDSCNEQAGSICASFC